MTQKYTEARKEGNQRWDEKNLDRVSIAMPKGKKDEIKAAAVASGQSMNAYIIAAIDEKIARDSNQVDWAAIYDRAEDRHLEMLRKRAERREKNEAE